jgi:dihydrofolate reductase / thymidylate synthase
MCLNRMRNFKICLLASLDEKTYGLAYKGNPLYKWMEDAKYLNKHHENKINAILMGKKSYILLNKPLNLLTLVVSKHLNGYNDENNTIFFDNIISAENHCQKLGNIDTLYIVDGSDDSKYSHYINNKNYDSIHLTFSKTNIKPPIDTFFPRFDINQHRSTILDNNIHISKIKYDRIINYEEEQYLLLLRNVLEKGEERKTRNSITKSLFGGRLEFNLRDGKLPLLTTKKVFVKGIIKELLWFLSGSTNAKLLQKDGVHIWDGNSSRDFLDKVGLHHLEDGDCGSVYGHQWRHFNAEYKGCDYDYTGKGIDQIQDCINLIKNDPSSRRIIFSGWNPVQLKDMSLPPCHVLYQFYVQDGYLSCQMYQRSSDLFLGLPFNIASCSLLIYMMSHYCDLKPGSCIITLGDYHIYDNHINAVNTQLERLPFEFPNLTIKGDKPDKIENYDYSQFVIENYKSHDRITASMIP